MQVSGRIVAHSESISLAFVSSSDHGGHLAVLVGSPRCDLECGGDEPKVRLWPFIVKLELSPGGGGFTPLPHAAFKGRWTWPLSSVPRESAKPSQSRSPQP